MCDILLFCRSKPISESVMKLIYEMDSLTEEWSSSGPQVYDGILCFTLVKYSLFWDCCLLYRGTRKDCSFSFFVRNFFRKEFGSLSVCEAWRCSCEWKQAWTFYFDVFQRKKKLHPLGSKSMNCYSAWKSQNRFCRWDLISYNSLTPSKKELSDSCSKSPRLIEVQWA